ncbi:NAD(P)H-dependent oxidoreductase [uncultured Campylobacter sp.]|uniref:NAD(P)H-dependent oxidoreductase n=1 Tax=uncultured Campylobacter sp. TaxID=218934 RepID=UPI00261B5B3F|nr:NAD(P)H-dependent oxidoreductase [uncultured Campylobacter sp.]
MKNLIVLVHPDIANSRANKAWREQALKRAARFDLHELYPLYSDFKIDVAKEQKMLEKYEKIIIEFPLYWYSYPPLLKKWFDDVFAHGWAYGTGGGALKGKSFALAVSIGDEPTSYAKGGAVGFSMDEVITPFKCAVNFVGATLLPSFFYYGFSFNPSEDFVATSAVKFGEFLDKF